MAALAYPRAIGSEAWQQQLPNGAPRRVSGERHLELVWSRPEHKRPSGLVILRRRAMALVLVMLVGAGAWSLASAGVSWLSAEQASPAPAAATSAPVTEWRVKQGDTLWAIARSAQPTGDVRPLVQRLSAERGGQPLQVGETIKIPR